MLVIFNPYLSKVYSLISYGIFGESNISTTWCMATLHEFIQCPLSNLTPVKREKNLMVLAGKICTSREKNFNCRKIVENLRNNYTFYVPLQVKVINLCLHFNLLRKTRNLFMKNVCENQLNM